MPGLPLFTDNHVRGPLIKALRQRGRDVVRAVDLFGQENDDAELFACAAKEGRVFLTCDDVRTSRGSRVRVRRPARRGAARQFSFPAAPAGHGFMKNVDVLASIHPVRREGSMGVLRAGEEVAPRPAEKRMVVVLAGANVPLDFLVQGVTRACRSYRRPPLWSRGPGAARMRDAVRGRP